MHKLHSIPLKRPPLLVVLVVLLLVLWVRAGVLACAKA